MQLNYRLRDYTGVFDIGYVQFTFSFYELNYTPYTVPGAGHGTKY